MFGYTNYPLKGFSIRLNVARDCGGDAYAFPRLVHGSLQAAAGHPLVLAALPGDGSPPPQGGDSAAEPPDPPAGEAAGDPWVLDPRRMPKRLSLDLPEPVLARLQERAARSGRSVDEIALDLIEAQLSDEPQS